MFFISFFLRFRKVIHIKYCLLMWAVVKLSIHLPMALPEIFCALIITEECPLSHLVTLKYFIYFCSKVTPHVLSAELTIPHFSCLTAGTPCLSASVFTNEPFHLQKMFEKKKDDEEITWPHTCSYWQPWSVSLGFSAICAQTVGQDEQEWRHRDNGGKFKEREGGCFRHKKTGIHLCIVCQFHGPWYPRTLNSQSKASRELYLITLIKYIIFE